MDLDSAEPTSRRRLFGALGAAGVASAAALAITRPATAAPNAPTSADRELLRQAMELELTARDLYRAAADATTDDDIASLASAFAANHAAYGDGIAAISGLSANTRNEQVYSTRHTFFTVDTSEFLDAARSLENTAVATHSEIIGRYESVRARTLTASIVMVEARMATVLAELGGYADDFDELFEPDAEALSLTGGA